MKDVTFTCPITQEYVNDLLTECFDYQNVSAFKADDGKYHWIYIIINKTNGHFLIGRRSKASTLIAVNIAKQAELQADVLRFGLNAFVKFDLCYYKTYQEMMDVAANMFGDEFINVFNELGTCYNSKPLNVDEDVEAIETVQPVETVKPVEIIQPVETVKPVETVNFVESFNLRKTSEYRRWEKYHHIMMKDGVDYLVPNDKCIFLAKNGFLFSASWIELFRGGEVLKKHVPQDKRSLTDKMPGHKFLTDFILSSYDQGWRLAVDKASTKEHVRLRNELRKNQNQLSLNLDNQQKHARKSFSRAVGFFIVKKDSDPNVFVSPEELQEYLRNGYYIVKDFISIKKGYEAKTISMISSSSWVKTDEDKIAIRKIKSRELLSYLDSGWKC